MYKAKIDIRLVLLEIWRGGCQTKSPLGKTTLKSPALLGLNLFLYTHHSHPLDWEKNQLMVTNVFGTQEQEQLLEQMFQKYTGV